MLFNQAKIILDLCGGTGSWSKPYKDAGYDVRVIDPLAGSGDTRLYKKNDETIYGVLAAPPCTHFAGSGARHWQRKGEAALLEGLSVVDACVRIVMVERPEFWALENPVGRLKDYLGQPKMYFDPCDYGDAYTKKTCLWGKFEAPKKNRVEPQGKNKGQPNDWYNGIGKPKDMPRWVWRSMTPQGFARAFFEANQ